MRNAACTKAFGKAAKPTPEKHTVPPLSLRLSMEERVRLEREAAGRTLSAHVRERLFGEEAKPRRTRGKAPVKDHQALARVLAALGRSELTIKLEVLTHLVEAMPEEWCAEDSAILQAACADVKAMRADLMKALGLRAL